MSYTQWVEEMRRESLADQALLLTRTLITQLDDPQTRINSAALAVKESLRATLAAMGEEA